MSSVPPAQPFPAVPVLVRAFLAVATLLVFGATVSALQAQEIKTLEDVERLILDTNSRLKTLDDEISSSQTLKKELQKALQDAQSNVSERESRVKQLESDIALFDDKLRSLEKEVEGAQSDVESRRQALISALRNAQVIGKQTALKIVLQHDDPAMADRLAVYTDYVLDAQNASIREQLVILRKIEQAHELALKDRNWLNYLKRKASEQRDDFATAASTRRRSLGEVEATLSSKTRTVAELRSDQQRLQNLMEELKAQQSDQSGYFAAGKGRYLPPVNGEIHARYGEVKSVGKLRWNGMFFKAAGGLPVHSVADGEVVYSDFLRGFGMLVIVDHGDGYTSLYGGNRDVTVQNGQWVDSGATIATVGDSGGQNLDGVYFEIRHNAEAVDPEEWLSPEFRVAGRP